ncbi:MAG: GFA family protein, partial [Alphaproteobacteria bacterium]
VPTADSDFNLLSGEVKIYVKTAESGGKREQAFCPECGTALYTTSVGEGSKILRLRTATADQRDQLPPQRQGWMRSRQSWLDDLPNLPGVEKQPG